MKFLCSSIFLFCFASGATFLLAVAVPVSSSDTIIASVNLHKKENTGSFETLSQQCNCTISRSKYCTKQGTCNAGHVGKILHRRLGYIKRMMTILWEFPGDRPRREWRDEMCDKMTGTKTLTDLVLLDFNEWKPVCGRLIEDGEEIHMCTLAPASTENSYGRISVESVNQKISNLYRYLGCDSKKHPTYSTSALHYCTDSDFCNSDALPVYDEEAKVEIENLHNSSVIKPEQQQRVRVKTELKVGNKTEFSVRQILLYFVGPAVLLLLILIVVVLIYTKPGAWKYVFPVAKVAEKNNLPSDAAQKI